MQSGVRFPCCLTLELLSRSVERCLRDQNNVQLLFVKRSANMVALCLERASYFLPDRDFDGINVLIEVRDCVLIDLSMQ